MENSEFIASLLNAVPELEPVRSEHLRDNGELLPHVMMGEIRVWALRQPAESRGVLAERVLVALEDGMAKGDPVAEMIVVSFLENLDPAEEQYEALVRRMGPRLREGLRILQL